VNRYWSASSPVVRICGSETRLSPIPKSPRINVLSQPGLTVNRLFSVGHSPPHPSSPPRGGEGVLEEGNHFTAQRFGRSARVLPAPGPHGWDYNPGQTVREKRRDGGQRARAAAAILQTRSPPLGRVVDVLRASGGKAGHGLFDLSGRWMDPRCPHAQDARLMQEFLVAASAPRDRLRSTQTPNPPAQLNLAPPHRGGICSG